MTPRTLKGLRALFYLCLSLLSVGVSFGLVYLLALYITASRDLAADLIVLAGVLIAPFLFVVLYWTYRCEFRPHRLTSEEDDTLSRGTKLVALSALPYIFGAIAWKGDWLLASVIALAVYVALTVYYVRLLWRAYRRKHQRLIAEDLLSGERQKLDREQRNSLCVAITIAFVINVFAWTGIYYIYHGAISLGILLVSIGAILCYPMSRKLRQAVVIKKASNPSLQTDR